MDLLEQTYTQFRQAMANNDAALIKELLDRVRDVPGPEAEALADLIRSGALEQSGAFPEAIAAAYSAKARYQDLRDDRGVIRSNVQLIQNYQSQQDHTSILELCHENLHLNETVQEPNVQGGTMNTLGLLYRETGDYPAAIEYLEKALTIFKEQDQRRFIANVTCNIGGLYFYLERYDDALRYLEEGIAMQREVGNVEYEIGQSLALAKTLLNMNRTEEGVRLMTEMYQRAIELGRSGLIANAVIDLARHAVHQYRFEEALELLASQQETIDSQVLWSLERDTVKATALANLKQYDEARAIISSAIERAVRYQFKGHVQNYHRILRDIAKEVGDFEGYIRHNDEQQRLREELRGADTTRKVALLESEKRITAIRQERDRERAVLYSTLPREVADRMIRGDEINDRFDHACVLFADVVGFTTASSSMDPSDVIALLADLYHAYDAICREHGVTKVKTIGDSYLCFKGDGTSEQNAQAVAAVAAGIQRHTVLWPSGEPLTLRIGIHSGPVSAGVIGSERLQYDIWGDTVNLASRMESTGEPGRIQVSSSFARALCLVPSASDESNPAPGTRHPALTERGAVEVKGKGTMTTFWLE